METSQADAELASEHAAENLDRRKERIAWAYPAAVIRRQSARRNGAVYVRVQQQVLSPGMQNADNTDFRTQVFWIGSHRQQCFCTGSEQ
jgi:hypothetical protein